MKKVELYIPKLEDYWYQEKIQSDPLTMDYNKGYDVNYYGYHYDTGCIDFPKDKWEEMYNKRIKENRYFAYIKDLDLNEYVGYVNYQYVNDKYECGILIESKYRGLGYSKPAIELLCKTAKENGIKELYDNFEVDRVNALELFESCGFRIVKEETWNKFDKEVRGVIVKKEL